MRECWVCLRITSAETLKCAHKIWRENSKTARKIGLKAADIIQEAYLRNPMFFCGKSRKSILGGLFYLLGFQLEARKTERLISYGMSCTEITIKSGYRRWVKSFPECFPQFGFETVHCMNPVLKIPATGLFPTFKDKRVNLYFKKEAPE